MADLVVGLAKSLVDGALSNVQAAIEEDVKLRQSAARNLVFITGEFEMMRTFLNMADIERLENPVVRTWVRQISDLAYDVEDCIEFVVHLDKRNRWWLRLLKPVVSCLPLATLPLDEVVEELDQLKARVEDVSSRNTRYNLINDSGSKPSATSSEKQQPSSSSDAVGGATAFNTLFEAALKSTHKGRQWDLTQLLNKKDDHDLDLGVISILGGVGGGELGMASIARDAYTDRETCQNFACRAWVKVMHPFDPHEFVRSLTAQFHANKSYNEEGEAPVGVQILMNIEAARGGGDHHPLKDFGRLVTENRFLVVLEDLSTMAEWEDIRTFFPDRKNGSCIILSTQQFEVASSSVGHHPYQVLRLNQLSADGHSVYAFFTTKGSQYDADIRLEVNNAPANNNRVSKKEAAKKWIEENPLVGRWSDVEDLGQYVIVAWKKRYQVVSVWGIAGVGKSALVKYLFCARILQGLPFQKYGWVDISHPFNLWDFSRVLLSNLESGYLQASETADLCTMGSKNPIVECREILKSHKCLVVIDGLQSKKEWDLIQAELVSGSNPRNVIIAVTTDVEIATYCCGDKGQERVFNVKGLEADTAIELFQKVFVTNMFCDTIPKGKLFQMYGWVDVSPPFRLLDFPQELLSNFGSGYLQASENPIEECRQILKQYECLVVIGGLQSTNDWELIHAVLVSGSNRQNVFILVTTDVEIPTYYCGDNVKGLKANAAAFELFQKVAKKEVREFTSMCGGLPKLIVEIAGSFAKDPIGLERALSSNNKFMRQVETSSEFDRLRGLFGWMNLYLRKCFHNFPDSLKPCILYLPIFPRDYLIRRRRLVRRWIAEGYSRDSHEVSAEMTGEKQFSNLLDLSIIQQQTAFGLGGDTRMVFCQVNGFFREYIVSHQMEENLVFELSGSCALTTQRTGRHLAISKSWVRDRIVFESIDFSRLRSLTVFGKWESFFISESMKLLRVLDLEGASKVEYGDLKKMVKTMCRLKYLSLRGCCEICHLPSSVGDMRQLQTLDVRHTSIVTLPMSITKLQKLQYIRAGRTTAPAEKAPAQHHLVSELSNYYSGRRLQVGVVVPPGIGKLTALHTLGVVNVSASGTKAVLKELKKLTHLRKLGVSGINKNNSNKFFLAISVLVHLESLSVRLETNNEGCLDGISLPLRSLRSLKLHGLGDRLPKWRGQLTELTKMDLEIAKLTQSEGVIEFLGKLPQLCILRLHVKQLQDNRLNVSVTTNEREEDSFKKMRIFEIACSSCSHVTFGSRTMEILEQLKVDCCGGSSLFGLNHLPQLKKVLLKGSSCSDEALKADLMTKLANHPTPKKPVMKLEKQPSSS